MRGLRSIGGAALGSALLFASAAMAARLPEGATYVAMGSSYAAGPGITTAAPDSPGRCGQSADNYPRQLARRLKLKLVDRSCGGATTADVLQTGPLGLASQVDGLTPDARLVTVTIGGNDVRYMAGFGAAVCRQLPQDKQTRACETSSGFSLDAAFKDDEAGLRAIAAEVRKRSPQARLVFVDYVTVLPPRGVCAVMPISVADADELRARAERLARLTEKVARETGADLIKASDLTRGHDACAADPWTEGLAPPRDASVRGPASFHPLLPAMTAIAGALEAKLRK
jgi:lysophospholipase L1-like esterase